MSVKFNVLTNTDIDNTGFQNVIFGEKGGLLEVELNEAQLLAYARTRKFYKSFLGNIVENRGVITYDSSTNKVSINGSFIVDGYLFTAEDVEFSADNGDKIYVDVALITQTKDSTIRKNGWIDGKEMTNPIEDTRVGYETTRRQSLEFNLGTEESETSVLIAEVVNDSIEYHIGIGVTPDQIYFEEAEEEEEIESGDTLSTLFGKIKKLFKSVVKFDEEETLVEEVGDRDADTLGGTYNADSITKIIGDVDELKTQGKFEVHYIETYSSMLDRNCSVSAGYTLDETKEEFVCATPIVGGYNCELLNTGVQFSSMSSGKTSVDVFFYNKSGSDLTGLSMNAYVVTMKK